MNHHVVSIARHPASVLKRCLCFLLIAQWCVLLLPFGCFTRTGNTAASMGGAGEDKSASTAKEQNDVSEKSSNFLTFRAGPDIDEDALKLIQQRTEPHTVTVKAHQSLDQVMQTAYGDFKAQMADLVRSANPTFPEAGSDVESTIQLPAGPYFLRNVQIDVPKDGTLSALSEILQGREDVSSLERINKAPKGGWKKLKADATIILPFVTRYVTYPLRDDVTEAGSTTLVEVLQERPGITDVFVSSPAMIEPVGMASVAGTCTSAAAINSKWFQEALSVDSADLAHLSGEVRSVIAFLDTGLGPTISDAVTKLDPRFSYWVNRREESLGTSLDDDHDGYANDVHGVDVVARNDLDAEPVNKQRNPQLASVPDDDCSIAINAIHGTHVAGILSGNVFDGALRELTAKRIQVLPVKVTDEKAALLASAIADGLTYLRLKRSEPYKVVNLSFVDATPSTNTYKDIKDEMRDKLFVVAAGNASTKFFKGEQVNLDQPDRRVFPALLGSINRNVVTVAALNEAHGLAKFSYYGQKTVDLAAPGESILSTVRDFDTPDTPVATGFVSGTSQAAPFVSLTAALLFMMGLNDPYLVRRRLISATDFNPQLRDVVWSSGSLNIAKALSINNDYIQLKSSTNQEPIKGIISRPLNISVSIPGVDQPVTYPIEQVRKIIPEYWQDSNGKMWSALIISAEYLEDDDDRMPVRGLFFVRCELNFSSIEILKDGDHSDQSPIPVPLQNIEDITICDPPDPYTREKRFARIGNKDETKLRFFEVPQRDIR